MNQELKNKINWIENAIEEREAMLKKLQAAAKEHHEAADMGWWLTLAGGAQGGTAVAVTEGEEARQLKEAANTLERQIALLETERRVLQAKVDSS